jgi:hypothetical protein
MIETENIDKGGCGEPPSKLQLPKMGAGHGERLNSKPCQYPGCTKYYMGTGFSKYCDEHRKREYHKPVKIKKIDEINIYHDYNNADQIDLDLVCSLDGCGKVYTVKILPGLFIYPKYCELHRNEHKRKMFIKNKGV